MSQTQPYERLRVFRRAMRLVEAVYAATGAFPAEEKSGLTATLRRSSAALPGKVADAAGRTDAADAAKAFETAAAALREVETTLLIARRLRLTSGWTLRSLRQLCRRVEVAIAEEIATCEAEIAADRDATSHDLRLAA